ncbi:hypothetical protein V8E36_008513 [Tilletia maclaganii]
MASTADQQQQQQTAARLEQWLGRPQNLPSIALPTDYPRPANASAISPPEHALPSSSSPSTTLSAMTSTQMTLTLTTTMTTTMTAAHQHPHPSLSSSQPLQSSCIDTRAIPTS